MDIFNTQRLKNAERERDEFRNSYYDLQNSVAEKILFARKETKLECLIDTQDRLNNLYVELMSYKFKGKK